MVSDNCKFVSKEDKPSKDSVWDAHETDMAHVQSVLRSHCHDRFLNYGNKKNWTKMVRKEKTEDG